MPTFLSAVSHISVPKDNKLRPVVNFYDYLLGMGDFYFNELGKGK